MDVEHPSTGWVDKPCCASQSDRLSAGAEDEVVVLATGKKELLMIGAYSRADLRPLPEVEG